MGVTFPTGIEVLVQLRYLAVSGDIDAVPPSLVKPYGLHFKDLGLINSFNQLRITKENKPKTSEINAKIIADEIAYCHELLSETAWYAWYAYELLTLSYFSDICSQKV